MLIFLDPHWSGGSYTASMAGFPWPGALGSENEFHCDQSNELVQSLECTEQVRSDGLSLWVERSVLSQKKDI